MLPTHFSAHYAQQGGMAQGGRNRANQLEGGAPNPTACRIRRGFNGDVHYMVHAPYIWIVEPTIRPEFEEAGMKTKKKVPRSPAKLSALDDLLKEEGKLEDFQAVAIKEVLAWQIEQAMKANNISRSALASRMKTSRSQIGRLLDPKDGNVTLATLQRAARMVGRSLRLELV
jgi:antitoxin HicB